MKLEKEKDPKKIFFWWVLVSVFVYLVKTM